MLDFKGIIQAALDLFADLKWVMVSFLKCSNVNKVCPLKPFLLK